MATVQISRKLSSGPAIPRHLRPIQHRRGPGSAYRPEFARIALGASLLGATTTQLAELFSVSEQTVYDWRKAHPAFRKAIQEGSDFADARVAASLYQRCVGLTVTTETREIRKSRDDNGVLISTTEIITTETREIPPDARACQQWLHLRQGWNENGQQARAEVTVEEVAHIIKLAREEMKRRGLDFKTALHEVQPIPRWRPCPHCGRPMAPEGTDEEGEEDAGTDAENEGEEAGLTP
jgi:hypothetical protein